MTDVTVGPLDLSGADTSGFEPVPSGLYKGTVYEAEWQAVKNEGGKLPVGTPMLNVQFRLEEKVGSPDMKVENRRVFTKYMLPGEGYDAEKTARMKGMFVNFLKNLGYDEKKITKPGFNLDLEELKGKELCLLLGVQPENAEKGYAAQNTVKGTKPADAAAASSTGLL